MLPFTYAVRNLFRSKSRLLQTIGGSALVVLLVMAAVAINSGMKQVLSASGSPRNVILLGAGSEESIQRSEIPETTPGIAGAAIPGISTRLGMRAVSSEIHYMSYLSLGDGRRAQAMFRGVTPEALRVHPEVRITDGRFPASGEVMAGHLAWRKLGVRENDLKPGSALVLDGQQLEISGIFAAPGTVLESEIWAALGDLRTLAKRETLSCVVLRLDDPADFDLGPWPRDGAFAPCPTALGLYVVAPDAAWIARLAQAGVPTLQLRFKSDDEAAIGAEVRAAVRAVEGTASHLFINDHWRIAIEAGAYGVHLGQEDLDTLSHDDLDHIRLAGLRLGLSTHGYAEMLRADGVGPSYLAMGAVYPTTLKAMPTAPQGPGRLAAYARLMRGRPLVAIGGIDEARFAEVLPSGVGSIAVVRAVIAATAPEAAARRMMGMLDRATTSTSNL